MDIEAYTAKLSSSQINAPNPNERLLAALRDIAELTKSMMETDGSRTDRIIREGREGAMYGCDPADLHIRRKMLRHDRIQL